MQIFKRYRTTLLLAIVVVLGCLAGLKYNNRHAIAVHTINAVQTAFQNSEAAGSYRFDAVVTQTLIPQPTIAAIGHASEQTRFEMNGNVQLPDSLALHMILPDVGLRDPNVYVMQSDGQTTIQFDGQT